MRPGHGLRGVLWWKPVVNSVTHLSKPGVFMMRCRTIPSDEDEGIFRPQTNCTEMLVRCGSQSDGGRSSQSIPLA